MSLDVKPFHRVRIVLLLFKSIVLRSGSMKCCTFRASAMVSGNRSVQYKVERECKRLQTLRLVNPTVRLSHILFVAQDEMLGSVKAAGAADWSVLIMDAVTTKASDGDCS